MSIVFLLGLSCYRPIGCVRYSMCISMCSRKQYTAGRDVLSSVPVEEERREVGSPSYVSSYTAARNSTGSRH